MTTFYRRLRMRYGLRWHTGHPIDWSIVRDCIVALTFVLLFFYVLDAVIGHSHAMERLAVVEAKLELRERQIAQCLNGGYVGSFWDKSRKQYVAVSCNPATEIEYGKEM